MFKKSSQNKLKNKNRALSQELSKTKPGLRRIPQAAGISSRIFSFDVYQLLYKRKQSDYGLIQSFPSPPNTR
jgi:hypothetical protein